MTEPAPGSELYGLDPDGFTAARNALARALRAEGSREDAARVAKLRRPPVTAWALNMVARERPDLVTGLLDAGAALRAAMEEALGGDPSAMGEAQGAERRAVDAVTGAGAGYLEAAGRPAGDPARQRMAGTLRAAVVDPSAARLLRDGVLDADLDAPGFGLDALAASAPVRRSRPPPGTTDGGGTGRRGRAGADTARAEKAAGAAGAAQAGPEQEAARDDEARKHAGRLRAEADEADEAEQRARVAERSAAAAARRAQELRSASTDAGMDAERAVRRAEALRAEAEEAEHHASAERSAAHEAAARAVEARRRAGPRG